MRMEELANNNFIKGTDSVERYLLDIIKQYFSSNNIDDDSREYIIKKAVERMKSELDIDNAGVVSVNGQTGDVTITLDSLGGEPLIYPKLSAFNVNFGTEENTACEGNDPRLSDDRHPLQHTHEIAEINGLGGELSSINNNINLLSNKTHKHDNLNALNKIMYSGNKTEKVDLILLETIEDRLNEETTKINDTVLDTKTKTEDLINNTTNELNQYKIDYNNTKTNINNNDDTIKSEVMDHCDTVLEEKKDEINTEISNKITKTQLNSIINSLNQQFSIIYETNITGFITSNNNTITYDLTLPSNIVTALGLLNDKYIKINFSISYISPSLNTNVTTNLPFVYADAGELLYTIKAELINKSIIRITSTKKDIINIWDNYICTSIIKVKISCKNDLKEV